MGSLRSDKRELSPRDYTDLVLREVDRDILERVTRLAESGTELPAPAVMADLLQANLPDVPAELDPYYADIGPFYASLGAMRQLGGVTKQALDSRRRNETVLAMQTGDGTWLYPAWQFTGQGNIHRIVAPVLTALRGMDRWMAGIWFISEHSDLAGKSPRHALREGVAPETVARLALHDKTELTA